MLFRSAKKIRKSADGQLAQVLEQAEIDVVLDIGANIGQTGQRLRQAGYKGRIISFEPAPVAHEILARTARNDSLWQVAPRTAVGERIGDVTLNVSEATDMSSILAAEGALLKALPRTRITEKVSTPLTTLDAIYKEYCKPEENTFVKIDTQGYERQVLNGGPETLRQIHGLQMELSLFPLYEGEETYLSFLNDLHAWGFEPHMLLQTNFSYKLGRQLQIDAIFLRV